MGGAAGAFTRWGIGEMMQRYTRLPGWTAILVANLLACLLIGMIVSVIMAEKIADSAIWKTATDALIAAGFCGGLSTYSTFALDNLLLFLNRQYGTALFNTLTSIILCTLAVLLGMLVAGGLVV